MSEKLPEGLFPRREPEYDWKEHIQFLKNISEINKQTDPDDAWDRIQSYHSYMERHPVMRSPEIQQAQREFMERSGLNADEWTYYTAVQPKDTTNMVFTEEDMEKATGNFPEGFEFIAVPGQLLSSNDPKTDQKSIQISPFYWSIYIKRAGEKTEDNPTS